MWSLMSKDISMALNFSATLLSFLNLHGRISADEERAMVREKDRDREIERASRENYTEPQDAYLSILHMPGHLCLVLTQPEEDYQLVDSTAGVGWNRIQLNNIDRHTSGALCFWEFLKYRTAVRLKSSGRFSHWVVVCQIEVQEGHTKNVNTHGWKSRC